jgi:hypothetical protein
MQVQKVIRRNGIISLYMKRSFKLLLLPALTFVIVVFITNISAVRGEKETTTGVIVPLYVPPDSMYWNTTIDAKKSHPNVPIILIINPNNGPWTTKGDLTDGYVALVQKLRAAGIVVLGYTPTDYGRMDLTQLYLDIQSYKLIYHVNGILFDEMTSVPGKEGYYKNLNNYTKSQNLTLTVGNPGTNVSQSYVGTLDNLIIYEHAGLPGLDYIDGWHLHYNKKNFSIQAYGLDKLNQSFITQAKRYLAYIYITNGNLPNPWNTLPPYFSDLVAALDH